MTELIIVGHLFVFQGTRRVKVWHYLGGLQSAGDQGRDAADVSENPLAADVCPPGQVPQDAGDHLVELLAI